MNPHKICRQKRRLMDITQTELAERIGMSQSMIQHFENGRSNVSIVTLEKIAKVLDIPLAELFSEECK